VSSILDLGLDQRMGLEFGPSRPSLDLEVGTAAGHGYVASRTGVGGVVGEKRCEKLVQHLRVWEGCWRVGKRHYDGCADSERTLGSNKTVPIHVSLPDFARTLSHLSDDHFSVILIEHWYNVQEHTHPPSPAVWNSPDHAFKSLS